MAETVSLDPLRLQKFLERLIGVQNVFQDSAVRTKFARITESRHVMVHKAGIVDPKFKRITKHRGSIDQPIRISRTYALQSISLLKILANRIETAKGKRNEFRVQGLK